MAAQRPQRPQELVHRKCGLALCDCPFERRDLLPGFEGVAHAASDAGALAQVERLLEQRLALRQAKRWADADAALAQLGSMGVTVDDQEHSWGAGPPPDPGATAPEECAEQTADGALAALAQWAAVRVYAHLF